MSLEFDPNALTLSCDHFVDGARIDAGAMEIEVRRPSDAVRVGVIKAADESLVDRAVRSAYRAFRETGWAQADPLERAGVLKRWADLLERRRVEIGRIEAATTTRPVADATERDLVRGIGALRYFAEWADKIEGSVLAGGAGRTSLIKPEPWGVVASIAPFNFPLINAIWKSAPALAVGNAVVLKPSELTPCSALAIAECAHEAGLPPGLFNIVQGAGDTGGHLVRHPLVSKITFTGSSATGARVMAAAAETGTKPVTLELGGKSPQLVLGDVRDLDPVALNVANGFLGNSGQVCTAGTRLIVPEAICDDLVGRVIEIADSRKAGPTWQPGNALPPIISEKQAERIDAMLAQTLADGARVIHGGERDPGQNAGAYYKPTILRDVPESSIGFLGEFFGPVLSVSTYEDEADGIAQANHPTYGLAASVYTDDMRKAHSIPAMIDAGTVWVNAHGRQPDFATPQGGFKGSGFGKEMGRAGLESFLRHKTVWLNHG